MLIFQPVVFVDPWRANRLTPTLRKAKHTNGAEHPKRQILNNHVLSQSWVQQAEVQKTKGRWTYLGIPYKKWEEIS